MKSISLHKQSFIDNFLQPVGKINEQCIITLTDGYVETITSNINTTVFLYCKSKLECEVDHEIKINIGNVSKLQKAFECIPDETPEIQLHHNHLRYVSPELRFSYHLLEDGVIPVPTVNIEKLESVEIDTSFIISKEALTTVLRTSSFTQDSNKIYFYTKDGSVHCELNDRTMPNLDSVDMRIADSFSGKPIKTDIPLRLDWLRDFSTIKFENVNVRYNDSNKIVIFHIETDRTVLKYIVSGLTK